VRCHLKIRVYFFSNVVVVIIVVVDYEEKCQLKICLLSILLFQSLANSLNDVELDNYYYHLVNIILVSHNLSQLV